MMFMESKVQNSDLMFVFGRPSLLTVLPKILQMLRNICAVKNICHICSFGLFFQFNTIQTLFILHNFFIYFCCFSLTITKFHFLCIPTNCKTRTTVSYFVLFAVMILSSVALFAFVIDLGCIYDIFVSN